VLSTAPRSSASGANRKHANSQISAQRAERNLRAHSLRTGAG
jgi:hypothetical protein